MFVPLRYKLDIGSSPRIRVSQAQLMAVPGTGCSAPEPGRHPERNPKWYAIHVALMGTRLKARWSDTATPKAWQKEDTVECHE